MKVAIIGGGHIGEALARVFLAQQVLNDHDLLLIERKTERCELLKENLKCTISTSLNAELKDYEVIVLAVKPQNASELCSELVQYLDPKQLVFSVMAGYNIELLSQQLDGHKNIVRAMPNMPSQIGKGMTVYRVADNVSAEDEAKAERLLNAAGHALRVADENLVDAATAVSGSGPGYVYYLIANCSKAIVKLGFSEEEANLLVCQTLLGTTELYLESEHSAAELVNMVASKGGTTEAAIQVFEEDKLNEILEKGIRRAYERCRELAR